jgi:hypothetical protein
MSKGSFKIKGTKAQINKFLLESLKSIEYIEEQEDGFYIYSSSLEREEGKNRKMDYHWLRGTKLTKLCNGKYPIIAWYEQGIIKIEAYQHSYNYGAVEVEELTLLSKKYEIDFEITSSDSYLSSCQRVEIFNGMVIRNKYENFIDKPINLEDSSDTTVQAIRAKSQNEYYSQDGWKQIKTFRKLQ